MNIFLLLVTSCVFVSEAPKTPKTPETTVQEISPDSEKSPQVVVLLGLRPVGVSQAEADTLNGLIADFLGTRSEISVLGQDELKAMLEHQSTLSALDCEDSECMAKVALLANAAHTLSGSIGKVGQEYILTFNLIDSNRAQVVGNASLSLLSLDKAAELLPGALLEVFGDILGESAGEKEEKRFALAEGQAMSFAVLDLKAQGVSKDTVANLTQVLAAELKKVEGASVIGRDDIAAMLQLEAHNKQVNCSDVACLAEIGGALGVDKLVIGSVGKLGENFVLSLKLVDVGEVQVDSRVSESLQGQEEQLMWAMRHAIPELLGIQGDKAPGSLQVSANEAEATVFLNHKEIGVLPLAPIADLQPGR
ncbi:hypothetical protein KAI87_01660, partial [Myxococcota bacterium]|nr:hypothetical protein [Myxococcota bacterium]